MGLFRGAERPPLASDIGSSRNSPQGHYFPISSATCYFTFYVDFHGIARVQRESLTFPFDRGALSAVAVVVAVAATSLENLGMPLLSSNPKSDGFVVAQYFSSLHVEMDLPSFSRELLPCWRLCLTSRCHLVGVTRLQIVSLALASFLPRWHNKYMSQHKAPRRIFLQQLGIKLATYLSGCS